jgi:hypothetical protein
MNKKVNVFDLSSIAKVTKKNSKEKINPYDLGSIAKKLKKMKLNYE